MIIAKYGYRWHEGPQFETGNNLHFCLNGKNRAFFTLLLKPGLLAYTRDGRVRLDSSNRLVTLAGNFPVVVHKVRLWCPIKGFILLIEKVFFVDSDFIDYFKITMFNNFEQCLSIFTI